MTDSKPELHSQVAPTEHQEHAEKNNPQPSTRVQPSADSQISPDPWGRFGWVLSVIWLVFLVFPVRAALDRPPLQQTVGIAAIVAFAAIYVFSFVVFPRRGTQLRTRTLTLLTLIGLTLVVATAIEAQSVSLVPFIVAYAVFHQPAARAIGITLAAILLTAVYISLTGVWEMMWFVLAIIVLVAVTNGATRWIELQQHHHTELQSQYRIISERERVARDVHDVLGHSLTVITVKSELAGRIIGVDPQRAAQEVHAIEALAREALGEIRATVTGLRVVRLKEEIEKAQAALDSAGITHEFSGENSIDPRYEIIAAWILREAVTNVVRHSGAQHCAVIIERNRIVVSDDGRGIGEGQRAPIGTGLQGMRERAQATGGTLTFRPAPGGGTQVEVRW